VHKRKSDKFGYIFVRLPDEAICGLPSWMFHPVSAEFVIGPPLISASALTELRDLLAALPSSQHSCDRASVNPLLMEVPHEGSTKTALQAGGIAVVLSKALTAQ
jgi:hypothetical protein